MSGTILLADDSLTIQKVIELTFAETEYEVIAVSSGEDLITKLPECRPDLIICDVIMPGKDGYEVCQQIKSNPDTLHIPVILLTGTFEPFDRDRALAAGCSEIITKPFEARKLVETVEKLLQETGGASQGIQQPAPEPMGYEGQVTPPPIMPPPPASDGAEGLDFTTTGFDEMEMAGRAEEDYVAPPPEDGLDFDGNAPPLQPPPPPPMPPARPAMDGASTAPVDAPFPSYDEAPPAAASAAPRPEIGDHEIDHGPEQADDDIFAPPPPSEEADAPTADAPPAWADEAPPDWTRDQSLADIQGEETMVLPVPELPEDDAWGQAPDAVTEAAAADDGPSGSGEPWDDGPEGAEEDLWEQPSEDQPSPWDASPEEPAVAESPAAEEAPDAWRQTEPDELAAWDAGPEQPEEATPPAAPEPEAAWEQGAPAEPAAWDETPEPPDEAEAPAIPEPEAAWDQGEPEELAAWDAPPEQPTEPEAPAISEPEAAWDQGEPEELAAWDAPPEQPVEAEPQAASEPEAPWDQGEPTDAALWGETPEQPADPESLTAFEQEPTRDQDEPEEDLWHDDPAAAAEDFGDEAETGDEAGHAGVEAWGEVADEQSQPWDDGITEVADEAAAEPPAAAASDTDGELVEPWLDAGVDEDELNPQDETTADIELPEEEAEAEEEAPMPWSEAEALADADGIETGTEAAEDLVEPDAESAHDAESFAAEEATAPSPWEEEPRATAGEAWEDVGEIPASDADDALPVPDESEELDTDDVLEPAAADVGDEEWAAAPEEEPAAEVAGEPAVETQHEPSDIGEDADEQPAPELPAMVDEVVSAAAAAASAEVEKTVAAVMPESAPAAHQIAKQAQEAPAGQLSDADVERIARRVLELAHETIERIAWEVIPDMAEIVVRERIRQLEAQVETEHDESRPH